MTRCAIMPQAAQPQASAVPLPAALVVINMTFSSPGDADLVSCYLTSSVLCYQVSVTSAAWFRKPYVPFHRGCTSGCCAAGSSARASPAQAETVLNASLAALPSHGAPGRSVALLYLTRQARLPVSPAANASQPARI